MNPGDNFLAVAKELIAFGHQQGVDLEPLRNDFAFINGDRYIDFWRKDEMPWSGRPNDEIGSLHYSLEGKCLSPDNNATIHVSETGLLDSLEPAFALLNAWAVDRKGWEELPSRTIRRQQIG